MNARPPRPPRPSCPRSEAPAGRPPEVVAHGSELLRVEGDLRARLFEVLVENAADLHALIDRERRILYANRQAEAIFGRPAADSVGRSAFDFVDECDHERLDVELRALARNGVRDGAHLELLMRGSDGRAPLMSWVVQPFVDEHGELLGYALAGRDVTAQRQAERELHERSAFRRAVLRGLLDPVIAIDDHGTIQMASDSVLPVFGYRVDELVGRNITLLMPEPFRSAHDGHLARFRRTRVSRVVGHTFQFPVLRKDGESIDVELSVAHVDIPGRDGAVFIGSFRDVTQRRRAEHAERSMLKALASLGESAAMLAHEIKNPVTAVNLALRAVADKLGADEHAVLADLGASLKRLERQLRQTLDFARPLEIKRAALEPARLFRDVERSMRPLVERSGASLQIDVPDDVPPVFGDRALLEEVLSNLVSNALEAGRPGGCIALRARVDDDEIELLVDDDGPGIAESVRATLFKPFVTTKSDGTGLGLPICRRIVEELGGTLDLAGAGELGGACMRIRLPLETVGAPPGG